MSLPKGLYRADHVGSFLRPKEILAIREQIVEKSASQSDLRKAEDSHISSLVKHELDNGIRSITDGEMRRAYFHLDYLQHLDGVKVEGQIISPSMHKSGFAPPKLVITGKVKHAQPIQVDDFKHLEKCIDEAGMKGQATTKVCIPSPTMCHFRGGRESINKEAYPDLDVFFDDLAKAYQDEIQALYDAGARFVQLDDTNLAYLCDPQMRKAAAEERGEDLEALPHKYAALINKAISKRPKDMKIGIHLCRGNYRSQWFASGGYEPVSKVLFQELDVDAYFLEVSEIG